MTPYQSRAEGAVNSPRRASEQTSPAEGQFPLHRLPNICCASGSCHEVNYWPTGVQQDGWLQLDGDPGAPVPLDLIAFSAKGVTVALSAAVPLQSEGPGQLLTQAHGAGLSRRPVRCCWHRPHPQDSERQLAGLRLVDPEHPPQ